MTHCLVQLNANEEQRYSGSYYRNHPCTPSTDSKIITQRYLPCVSHVWPAFIQHMSRGCSKTLPYPFPLLPFPTAHYHTITGQKWFCVCTLGTLSTQPRAITFQTDLVVPGYQLLSSSSGGPRLGPPILFSLFCFVLFVFLSVSFCFHINYKFLITPFFG